MYRMLLVTHALLENVYAFFFYFENYLYLKNFSTRRVLQRFVLFFKSNCFRKRIMGFRQMYLFISTTIPSLFLIYETQ